MSMLLALVLLFGATVAAVALSTLIVCWWERLERRRDIEEQVDRVLREALVAAVDSTDSAR